MTPTLRSSATEPISDDAARPLDWTVALAGGEGVRLSEYIRRRFGQAVPKQYCRLLGRRSMLEHTLDRLVTITPSERTLVVIGAHHAEIAEPQIAGRADHIFRQPSSRDTGVALYVALAMIRRWTPHATVTITPTDHYVHPSGPYLEQIRAARGVARRMRDVVVLLGVHPTSPDADFGYVVLGERAAQIPLVRRVTAFVEKPPVELARVLVEGGALWNTMVTLATLDALWELARATQPVLFDALEALVPRIATPDEDRAITELYDTIDPVGFSHDILERAPDRLAILALEGIEWSDWGRPERVEQILARRRAQRRG